MRRNNWLYAIILVGLLSLACSFTAQIPRGTLRTGPTVTEAIEVEPPDEKPTEVVINFGAGKLNLAPGTTSLLVRGTATYNLENLKPTIDQTGGRTTLSHESPTIEGLPDFDAYTNEWDLQIGPHPMHLEIRAGAYAGSFDLGGLALESLRVSDGAASTLLTFSESNPITMESLEYETGASAVSLTRLGNANLERLRFQGGAGDYLLDFSGDLGHDMQISIDTGLSNVTIIIPPDVNAKVNLVGGLSSTTTSGDWQESRGVYTLNGSGPTLTFDIEIGAGALQLIAEN